MDVLESAKESALKSLGVLGKEKKKRRTKRRRKVVATKDYAAEGNAPALEEQEEVDWILPKVGDGLIAEEHREMAIAIGERFSNTMPDDEGQRNPSAEETDVAEGELPSEERLNDGDDEHGDDPQLRDETDAKPGSDQKHPKMSRRQRKFALNMSVADLKTTVDDPSLVEPWDVNSSDAHLHVRLKSIPNSVIVPIHWRNKRAYLQNKRGLEKQPYQLPPFLQETGVGKMREAYIEMESGKSLKQKSRDKIRPKMGKTDIDYQVLHDAFFKFQTKPHLTQHGDLYYELREMEPGYHSSFKPGVLSSELRVALGMDQARSAPPPWLINMQRVGPPPAYPLLKIPGLNAPIPPGASFGYHPGGWGRPPMDASGNALYGDTFGTGSLPSDFAKSLALSSGERNKLWGKLGEHEEPEYIDGNLGSVSDDDEDDEEDYSGADGEGDNTIPTTELDPAGTESTLTAINQGGVGTPADFIQLRKEPAHQVVEQQTPQKSEPSNPLVLSNRRYNIPKQP